MKLLTCFLILRLTADTLLAQSPTTASDMKTTITSGPQLADNANLAGSRFHNVNLSNSAFDDVNLSKTTFHDINFSDITITATQLGGAIFKHIGLPPGSTDKQRPLKFEECDLNHSTIRNCDLRDVEALILPGGPIRPQRDELTQLICKIDAEKKLLAAICFGPQYLGRAGILDQHRFTTSCSEETIQSLGVSDPYPRKNYVEARVVRDEHVITAKGSAFVDFAFAIIPIIIRNSVFWHTE